MSDRLWLNNLNYFKVIWSLLIIINDFFITIDKHS